MCIRFPAAVQMLQHLLQALAVPPAEDALHQRNRIHGLSLTVFQPFQAAALSQFNGHYDKAVGPHRVRKPVPAGGYFYGVLPGFHNP